MKKISKRKLFLFLFVAALLAALSITAYFIPFRKFLPALSLPPKEDGALRLHFLSIGQGDATIIEFSDESILIVDAGDGSFSQDNRLTRYIKGLRPKSISMLLSHCDRDHYGGFNALLNVFPCEVFYLPALPSDAEAYRSLLQTLEMRHVETRSFTRYSSIISGEADLVCISPYSQGESDENDSSIVLYLDYGGVRTLLCGDISEKREKKLLEEYYLDPSLFNSGACSVQLDDIQILKLAHHGSASASSQDWLSLLNPKTAIISCGRGNPYAHPAGETLARIRKVCPQTEILRCDELGDIVIAINHGNYSVNWSEL